MDIRINSPIVNSENKLIENKDSNNSINSFSDFLAEKLKEVNDLQKTSNELNRKLVTGEIDNMHQVMIASEKADIALQFTIQIRNKILDAYNEIMRMQI